MEKQMVVVVCDLCKKDRPAVAHVEIDVCGQHENVLQGKQVQALPYQCTYCPRTFATKGGKTRHETEAHGAEPATKAARQKRRRRKTSRAA